MKVTNQNLALVFLLSIFCVYECCLITNCPRGGKRNGRNHHETAIKQCWSSDLLLRFERFLDSHDSGQLNACLIPAILVQNHFRQIRHEAKDKSTSTADWIPTILFDFLKCISCGPGWTGQCFGPNICCGPFGCLLGSPETLKCQQEGQFNEPEPCIAGISNCRKNTGRCATDGLCCNQDSCHVDPTCILEEKPNTRLMVDSLYNLYHAPNQLEYGNEITTA